MTSGLRVAFRASALLSVARNLFAPAVNGRTPTKSDAARKRQPFPEARYGRHATGPSPQLPAVALNMNSNGPVRSHSRVHKPCQQLYSLPSIPPPPPPPSTSLPNYPPWILAIAPTTMVTTSIPPSTSPTPTPPLPPIQIAPFPPPTIPQTFSTLPNPSISIHLMFRVQYLPSTPLNNTPRLNSQINFPPLTHTPIMPFSWIHSRPISALRLQTYL
jgi:hypothetical protein